ncbi:thiamine phosphate synthase [Marinilactibacillus psychrotolerans]|uniref:Thiamine-phosphate synthase n=3 Tax=Marinilactibacillus psychrotolerans TaxID=191770 RepID=A0ABW8UK23_9LACT|nr:thiamine phosphate synthase [Marinilactibacillus psychrotolerans]SJN42677.1 Thiamin-phosphate pyrophosphorylase [Marinilactibacillus psychrotolerans 42ea]
MGKMKELTLYLVTGRYDFSDEEFLNIIETACQNGITMVQLREKDITTNRFYELAVAVKQITDYHDIPLIINDRVDICLAVDAAGVHIGDDEMPVKVVRSLIGNEKILGVSAKSIERGKKAEKDGADYLGVGAIFPTETKIDPDRTTIETLNNIAEAVNIPIVAIGGIKESNIENFKHTAISGVAVVSEVMLAEQVSPKVQKLKKVVEQILEGRE